MDEKKLKKAFKEIDDRIFNEYISSMKQPLKFKGESKEEKEKKIKLDAKLEILHEIYMETF